MKEGQSISKSRWQVARKCKGGTVNVLLSGGSLSLEDPAK